MILTVVLLILSNTFMTLAWYGHLKYGKSAFLKHAGLWAVILVSWGIALFEYVFQVPANRLGYRGNGGPFNLFQLKMLQEVITLSVFTVFALWVFKNEHFRWNYLVAYLLLTGAVYCIFKK